MSSTRAPLVIGAAVLIAAAVVFAIFPSFRGSSPVLPSPDGEASPTKVTPETAALPVAEPRFSLCPTSGQPLPASVVEPKAEQAPASAASGLADRPGGLFATPGEGR